jgi:hypothetical protein
MADVKHRQRLIDANDAPPVQPLRHRPGHAAGARGHVEHSFVAFERQHLSQLLRQIAPNLGDPLIELRGMRRVVETGLVLVAVTMAVFMRVFVGVIVAVFVTVLSFVIFVPFVVMVPMVVLVLMFMTVMGMVVFVRMMFVTFVLMVLVPVSVWMIVILLVPVAVRVLTFLCHFSFPQTFFTPNS